MPSYLCPCRCIYRRRVQHCVMAFAFQCQRVVGGVMQAA